MAFFTVIFFGMVGIFMVETVDSIVRFGAREAGFDSLALTCSFEGIEPATRVLMASMTDGDCCYRKLV